MIMILHGVDVGRAMIGLKRQVIWLLAKSRAGKKLKVRKIVGWLGYLVCISCVPVANLVGLSLNLLMRIKTYNFFYSSWFSFSVPMWFCSKIILHDGNSTQFSTWSKMEFRDKIPSKMLLVPWIWRFYRPASFCCISFFFSTVEVLWIPFPLAYIIYLFRPLHGDGWKTAAK